MTSPLGHFKETAEKIILGLRSRVQIAVFNLNPALLNPFLFCSDINFSCISAQHSYAGSLRPSR